MERIFITGTDENSEVLQDILSPVQDSNLVPLEYKSGRSKF